MVKKKEEVYCPLDNIPVVDVLPDAWVRVARNIHVSKKGWVVRYYHNSEWFVEEYADREALCAAWPGVPEKDPKTRHVMA